MHISLPLVLLLAITTASCSGSTDPVIELGGLGSKADQIRVVDLDLAARATRRFRVSAVGFSAQVKQVSQVSARLSAKHYDLAVEGQAGIAPTIEVLGDGTRRNWTLRVENLGAAPLRGQLTISALPVAPDGGGTTEDGGLDSQPDGGSSAAIGIISDLDKTVIPPGDPAPLPYPGVAKLYYALEFGAGGQAGDVTYVTARDASRVTDVPAYLAKYGLPSGPIEVGTGSTTPWDAEREKISDISRVLDARPKQRFILFGDSSHRDPEAYAKIRTRYPGRIVAIIIHKVTKTLSAHRVEQMHVVKNYAEATAVLYRLGVLDTTTARWVMKQAQAAGLAISDQSIDALLLP